MNSETAEGKVFFLAEPSALTSFRRSPFACESVAEPDFFDRAREAFP